MAKEKDAQKLQQKYLEMQIIDQQMKQIQKQLQLIESQITEIAVTKEALNDLKNTKTDSEILAPVSSGIFVKGKLADNEKLAVNVGSGTVVEKTIPDVIKIIEEQEKEIKKTYDALMIEMQKLGTKALQLEKSLSK
jgi:prefoldin alpha subunit